MSEQPAATILVCSEYQRLLKESQRARAKLERAPDRDLSLPLGRQGNMRRASSIAGEVRPSVHALAQPREHLPPVPTRVENCLI
jgi:hypothetical protein